MTCLHQTIEKLNSCDQVAIYGARMVAKEVAGVLLSQPYNLRIACFIVSDKDGNPDELYGEKVITLEEFAKTSYTGVIVVATLEKYLGEILALLNSKGYSDTIALTFESDLWSEIRWNAYESYLKNKGRSISRIEQLDFGELLTLGELDSQLHVYCAKCHLDKALSENLEDYGWEIPIQAGNSIADKTVCDICDDFGEDNISAKNKQYCELTALYWIWRNDTAKYSGLCHYRRHFLISEEMRDALVQSNIDAVLTVPIVNFPNIRSVYEHDHVLSDWETMLEVIREIRPEYYDFACSFQYENWYYAYNMFIAKRRVFEDYCQFLYPVLFECERRIGTHEDAYQNRYIGFLGERLLSVYFMYHKEYSVVVSGKHYID